MMLDRMIDNALLETAPPPLSPLEDVIISEHNVRVLNERKTFKRLPLLKWLFYVLVLPFQKWQLNRQGYEDLIAERTRLRPIIHKLAQIKQTYDRQKPAVKKRMAAFYQKYRHLIPHWNQLEIELRQLAHQHSLVARIERELEEHQNWKLDQRKQRKVEAQQKKEAAIYEQLIVDRLTHLKIAHHYQDKKQRTDKVKFSHIGMSMDRIWFQIDAGYKTMFGNWKTNIPQGVSITGQILTPETLDELSIACKRQVSGLWNPNSGAWIIVNRLDSIDGMMNYIRYADLMDKYDDAINDMYPIYLGVTFNREVVRITLENNPHWLIAGYTNTGKSNVVNLGIAQLITHHTPRDLRLVLIDLKGGLEFGYYEGLPHLHTPIVDKVEGVLNAVRELVSIMEMRFSMMKGKAKKYEHYRIRYPDEEYPRILCVFDEVASLATNSTMKQEIMSHIALLTQKGRAVGIHVWMCTQRPDIKAIEGAVKVNLSVRIAFRMSTPADSVTILGNGAAKDLPEVQGRAVLQLGPSPEIMQTAHIRDEDLMQALKEASRMQPGTPIIVDDAHQVVHQEWTIERIIEHSLKHMNPPGLLSARRIRDDIGDSDLTHQQARKLVEQIWNMGTIEYEGITYEVKTERGNRKVLHPVNDAMIQGAAIGLKPEPLPEPSLEPALNGHSKGN